MNEKKFQGMELVEVYTEQAGKQVRYIGRFMNPPNPKPDESFTFKGIEIRKSAVRYNFVAVHRHQYDGQEPALGLSFHARKALAATSAFNNADRVVKIVKVEHLADQCWQCGNFEAIGKDVDRCPACEACDEILSKPSGDPKLDRAESRRQRDITDELFDRDVAAGEADYPRKDTQERISADVKRLGDQWIEECMFELNLKIVLRQISEGERQVLAEILKQVRAGRGA